MTLELGVEGGRDNHSLCMGVVSHRGLGGDRGGGGG